MSTCSLYFNNSERIICQFDYEYLKQNILGHFFSSELSIGPQSGSPSHLKLSGIHNPESHVNSCSSHVGSKTTGKENLIIKKFHSPDKNCLRLLAYWHFPKILFALSK
jgi:hypothetical protein